jgi:hypothetical protein
VPKEKTNSCIGRARLLDNRLSYSHIGRFALLIFATRKTLITVMQQMIQDLKMDSTRWQQEQGRQDAGRGGSPYAPNAKVVRHPDASVVAYQDSRTHAARQHYGPSESFAQGREREPSRATHTAPQYATSEHYTTTPTASPSYGSVRTTTYPVQQTAYATAPRTQPDPYAYAQPGREQPSYAAPVQYAGYSHTVAPEPYRQPPPPTHSYPTPRYFAYFDERVLVHR